jgi:hypothetical protein
LEEHRVLVTNVEPAKIFKGGAIEDVNLIINYNIPKSV